MASDFLKNMARQQAEKIDREYGADAYGGSKWRAEHTSSASTQPTAAAGKEQTEETSAPSAGTKKASAFLQGQAKAARERIDREYGADAYGGSNYQFGERQSSAVSWPSVERAQTDLQAWGGELDSLYSQLETSRKDTEAKAAELEGIYKRLQAYQADSRFGSDTLINSAYDNLARQYNELLPSYLEAATAHDDMAQQYNALLEKYQSGYDAYTTLLSGQGDQAAELLAQAEELEKQNQELARSIQQQSVGLSRAAAYGNTAGMEAKLAEDQAAYQATQKQIEELRQQAATAQSTYYASIPLLKDYAQYSAAGESKRGSFYGSKAARGDDLYDFINNLPVEGTDGYGYRDMVQVMSMGTGQNEKYGSYTPYSYMTEDEIGVYNYLYATQGQESAEAFLSELQNSLNYRQGSEDYENLSGVGKALYWLPAGVDRFASGIEQLFSKKALPTSPMQYTSSMISQGAHDASSILGTAYDLGTTISNMAPSILLGYLSAGVLGGAGVAAGTAGQIGGAVGSASMGLSAGGNAYTQKVNEGYTPEQARSYASLVGVSEAALQYLLGGIAGAGGVGSEQVLAKLAPKIASIDNALLRAVVDGGVRLAVRGTAEGIEEGLQELLEPAFATMLLGEEYDWGENFENAAYSFLMGFLASGVIEGISMAAGGRGGGNGAFDANMDGYMGEGGTDYFAGCNTAEEVEARYKELARQNHPDLGGDTAVMAEINRQHDMRKAWYAGRQQAQEQAGPQEQTKTEAETQEGAAPLALPSLTEETAAPMPVQADTSPAAQGPTPDQAGVNYAEALQRAGTDAETAEVAAYFLERAAQGMTLTADQRSLITSAPGGAALLATVQPDAQPVRTAQETAQEGFPGQEGLGPKETENGGQRAAETPAGAKIAADAAELMDGGMNRGEYAEIAGGEPSAAVQGDAISDGGQGRFPGAGTGEQAGELAAGPARAVPPAEQGRTAVGRQNRGKHLRATKVSSMELGLANGTETPSVSLVAEADWDEGLRATAERVRQETGLPVTYVLGSIPVRDAGGVVRNVRGVYTADQIILQADNLRVTTDQIADHEIFHDKAFQTPGLVRDVELRIMEQFTPEEFAGVVQTYVEKLRGVVDVPANATPDEIDEALAVIKEEIMADAYAGINAFSAHAERFQGAVEETLEEKGVGRETAAATDRTTGPPDRYSYGGKNANRADSESQREAETMEMQGVDQETIREQTGWFRGADGKWRFEIDDSGMVYHDRSGGVPGQTLADYLTHDELFANYPQLRKTKLEFAELGRGIQGQYDAGTDTITLNEALRDAPEGTLIHEIQHAIQRAEGFARGANDKFWSRQLESGYDGRTQEQRRETQRLRQEYNSIREQDPAFFRDMLELSALVPDMPRGKVDFDTLEQIEEDPPEWQRYDEARAAMEEKYSETRIWDFDDLLYRLKQAELTPGRTGTELYYDTAGEIEARDAARRRTLTAEERRARRPDIGNEDTVFAEDTEDWMGELDAEYGPQLQGDLAAAEPDTQGSIEQVAAMKPVASITGEEFRKGETDLISQVEQFFNEQGNRANNPYLGEVILDRRGIKSDIGHGIGRKKAAAFAAVPDVIAQGQVVDYRKNWKGRGYDTAVIAAPIEIGGQPYLAGVVLTKSNLTNRFYLHEVLTENDGATPFKTGAQMGEPGGDTPSVISILEEIRAVKHGTDHSGQGSAIQAKDNQGRELTAQQAEYFRDSQARDSQGRLLTLYHQTGAAFTVFEPRHQGAGTRDSGTPFGIFLKPTAKDIGLKGKTVMELYANITNPLYASNREALNYSLIKLSDEYEAIKAEIDTLDATYHEKFEQAKQKLRDFMTEWRKKNPDASRRALYDVPEFNRLYDAEDSVIDEWGTKADELSLRAKEAITSALQEAGYDGVHLQEDAGSFGRSVETWIALEPSQVKNVTNTTPTSSPDIRFSVDESPDTAEQEDREQPAAAEGKKRRQRAKKPVAESLPIIAKRDLKSNLLNLFSIPAGQKAELGGIIDQYAERLLKNGELTQADRDAFFDRMYAAGVMTMPADEYYATGREAVKGGKVYVTESEKHEFGDDWNEFRKRAFANGIYLTSSREDRGVDQWNMELAETLPGLFDAGELDSRSILERIVQVAEEGKDQKLSLAEYAAELAGQEYISEDEILDNMERQMDWALRTFAEKAQLEIHLRDRTGVKIAQEREKFSEATKQQRERDMVRRAEERAERKAMQQRQREHRELRELQERTLKQLQWLSKNRWRAPEELRAAFDEVLGDIDIYAIGAANEMNWSRKYEATWKDLAQLYKTARETDPNFLPSKELEKIVARLDGDKIADLDVDALQDLYRAAVGLRTEFYNRNNVVGDELNRLFEEVYADSKREIETAAGGYKGKGLDKFLNLEQLTPMNVLERMGGWTPDGTFYSMAKQLEEGERSVRDYTVRAKRRLESFLTEHEDWVKKADGQGKDAVWYELEVPELLELGMGDKPIFGKTITVYMTPAQKVHLYLESKNYDNLRHMTGGRTFANRELYSQGKRQEALAQGTTIRLAPETVKKIVSDLTDEEMELAQVLEKYYNDFAKGEINRVANILYGYDKAQSRDYAPIFTNQNYTKSEIGIFDTTAEGVGHLKARQFSKNPSYNISAFDAFERHVDQTARFVGMSIPARNWQTLLNWREKNNSMGDVITHKWGEEGKKYIEDLLNELQGGSITKRSSAERLMDTALSNYISSVFGFNPSIVFKQAMSFPLAGTYLGWENIPNIAAALRTDDGLINTYTSELAYRLMGYATPETAQLKNNPSAVSENKVLKFTFGGGAITAMDGWTVKTIWRWAENKVRRDMPELETGTAEQIAAGQSPFYQEVAKSFEEAVSRSQPMYDVMHRAEIMRNSSKAVRAITLFKTVPIQQYNMLRQTVGEAQQAKRDFEAGKSTEEDFRAARGKAGRAVLSVILAAVGIEAINFLAAMLKNKGKQYRDEDGDLTWESAGQQFLQGFVQDNAGMIAGGDLVAELLGSIVTGDRWYGIDTPGVTQIAEVAEQIVSAAGEIGTLVQDAYDILSNGGDLGEYFRRHGADYLGYLDDALETVAAYFGGIAAGNVKAYVLGALRWISPEFTTAYEDALSTADKAGLAGLTGGALETRVGDILHNRLGETAEGTAAELAALYEAGYKKAVPTDTPASVTVNGEDQKLSAYQQQTYDAVWRESVAGALDELLSQDWYTALDSGSREKVLAKLYDYGAQNAKAALFDEFEADSFVEKIRDFRAAGLSTVDYLEAWRKSAEIDDSGANASGRATEFAYWADTQGYTAQQAEVVKNSFTVFSHLPVEPERYTKLQAAGLSDGEAKELTEALAALEPLDGAASVSDMQRLRTIAAAGLDTETMKAAMGTILGTAMATESGGKSQYALMLEALDAGYTVDEWLELKEAGYMTESAFDKVRISGRYDISPAQYIRYRELLLTADALNEDPDKRNGSVDQDETAAAINGMLGLTDEQKAVLWQLQNKSWKAIKNPFDSAVGQTVYDYLHEEELPSLTDGGLPSLSLPSLDD